MTWEVRVGDCRALMAEMDDCSVDAVVCDPPYELNFMGKGWDASGIAYDVEVWRQALRVLKPGGHLLAFSGSRTYHRMTVAIEDAGFEIRDQIMWVYGCLDDQTLAVTERGAIPYQETTLEDRVLCYDVTTGGYSYQPILERVEYEYDDIAYRLVGNFGEQVVSRSHRVIVERNGKETFQFAETCEQEICVPVLENLQDLQSAFSDFRPLSGSAERNMLKGLQVSPIVGSKGENAARGTQGENDKLPCLSNQILEAERLAEKGEGGILQQSLQRNCARARMESARLQRAEKLEARERDCAGRTHDGRDESSLEGWIDVSQPQGEVCEPENTLRSLPSEVYEHGAEGWLCNGASFDSGGSPTESANQIGICASSQSQCNGQRADEFDVVRNERGPQEIRAWAGHKTSVVRVVPFHLTGKVWCLRVPTGAFVAVRNGVAFPTGNSGFPKSHNVSVAIDKQNGVAPRSKAFNMKGRGARAEELDGSGREFLPPYEASTAEAKQWQGYGTALKPAHEPICVARKPLDGTVAGNVLKHGVGGLNIDGARISSPNETISNHGHSAESGKGKSAFGDYAGIAPHQSDGQKLGRFPANLIHDGSDEVLALFPHTKSGYTDGTKSGIQRSTFGKYGDGTFAESFGDSGSAARFFYTAKASQWDRNGGLDDLEAKPSAASEFRPNHAEKAAMGEDGNPYGRWSPRKNIHPTVKPTDLMRYLCRLVTPPGGLVLDPFTGSGSTGRAALLEGFNFIGCELSEEYAEIARGRISYVEKNKDRALVKPKPIENNPYKIDLF